MGARKHGRNDFYPVDGLLDDGEHSGDALVDTRPSSYHGYAHHWATCTIILVGCTVPLWFGLWDTWVKVIFGALVEEYSSECDIADFPNKGYLLAQRYDDFARTVNDWGFGLMGLAVLIHVIFSIAQSRNSIPQFRKWPAFLLYMLWSVLLGVIWLITFRGVSGHMINDTWIPGFICACGDCPAYTLIYPLLLATIAVPISYGMLLAGKLPHRR